MEMLQILCYDASLCAIQNSSYKNMIELHCYKKNGHGLQYLLLLMYLTIYMDISGINLSLHTSNVDKALRVNCTITNLC